MTGASLVVQLVKNPSANAGDTRDAGFIPGLEDPLEKEVATCPLFLPENCVDREAWQATVHGVAKLDTTEHTCTET